MGIVLQNKNGKWQKTGDWLDNVASSVIRYLYADKMSVLAKYGQQGVDALASATPKDTGLTSKSWYYEITKCADGFKITWCNDNINEDVNVALILQYGHGTGTGGYVEGIDYINPAMKNVFSDMAIAAWTEVVKG